MSSISLIGCIILYGCLHYLVLIIRIKAIKLMIKENTHLSDIDSLERIRGKYKKELYNNVIRGNLISTTINNSVRDSYTVHVINFRMDNCRGEIYRIQTKYGAPIYYFTQYNLWIRGRRHAAVKYLDKVLNSYSQGITDFKETSKITDLFINK